MWKFCVYLSLIFLLIKVNKCQKSYKREILCETTKTILFTENNKNKGIVEIVFKNNSIDDCFIYGDKYSAEKTLLKQLCKPKVSFVSKELLSEWGLKCSEWLLKKTYREKRRTYSVPKSGSEDTPINTKKKVNKSFFEKILIFPGTKWCGKGNIAADDNDLGQHSKTDQCCRAHDRCFDSIPGKESKHNLTNSAIYTKSHCDCDDEFRKCLKSVGNSVADKIITMFFKVIQIQCFKKYYPIIKCLEYREIPFFGKKCQKYSFNYRQKRVYQFFDPSFV